MTDTLGLGPYQFAITEHGALVRSIGLHLGGHEGGSVGYWCAREARGGGITTRAVWRLIGLLGGPGLFCLLVATSSEDHATLTMTGSVWITVIVIAYMALGSARCLRSS